MEPTTTQETQFDVTVYTAVNLVQRLQVLIGGLFIFVGFPTYVILHSTLPPWLIVMAEAIVITMAIIIYGFAKPRIFTQPGFKLVRKELRRRRIHITSIQDSGRFVAVVETIDMVRRIHGVITLVSNDEDGFMQTYRINLLPA